MGDVAAWVGLGISVIVFLGAAATYLRGSRDKGTIVTLEASNRALIERVGLLEGDAHRLQGRVEALERENAALLAQRPSAERLDVIERKLDTHDTETRKLLRAIVTGIQREVRDGDSG